MATGGDMQDLHPPERPQIDDGRAKKQNDISQELTNIGGTELEFGDEILKLLERFGRKQTEIDTLKQRLEAQSTESSRLQNLLNLREAELLRLQAESDARKADNDTLRARIDVYKREIQGNDDLLRSYRNWRETHTREQESMSTITASLQESMDALLRTQGLMQSWAPNTIVPPKPEKHDRVAVEVLGSPIEVQRIGAVPRSVIDHNFMSSGQNTTQGQPAATSLVSTDFDGVPRGPKRRLEEVGSSQGVDRRPHAKRRAGSYLP
jgi:hypothetical protein